MYYQIAAWSGVVVGVVVWLHGSRHLLSSGYRRQARPWGPDEAALTWLLCWGVALGLCLYLGTLPTRPPYSPGQLLGQGFLAGVALMAVSVWVWAWSCRLHVAAGHEERTRMEAPLALAGCALLAANAVFLVWRKTPVEPLMGFTLAVVFVGALLRTGLVTAHLGLGAVEGGSGPTRLYAGGAGVEQYVICAVCFSLGVVFSATRFPSHAEWWCGAIIFGAISLLAVAVGCAFVGALGKDQLDVPPRRVAALVAVLAAAVAAAVLAWGARGLAASAAAYGAGLMLFGIGACLVPGGGGEEGRGGLSRSMRGAVMGALLSLGAFVVAFKVQAGTGVAVALIAGLVPALLGGLWPARAPAVLGGTWLLVTIALLLLSYRLFLERLRLPPDLDLSQHYSVVGLAIGLLLPYLWLSYGLETAGRASRLAAARGPASPVAVAVRCVIGRMVGLGGLVVLPALVLLVLWRERAAAGSLLGLGLAQMAVLLWLVVPGVQRVACLQPGLLSLGSALVACQFAHLVVPLADLTRPHKAVVAAVAALLLVWAIGSSRAETPTEEAEGSQP